MKSINQRYEIESPLGSGGAGYVYRVSDRTGENENIAIKILRKDKISSRRIEHFEQEFKILSSFTHPHIEEVYDYGEVKTGSERLVGSYYFTCELLKGEDLYQATRNCSWEEIVEYMVQCCRALQFIHGHNLIHFDVKPDNFVVVRERDDTGIQDGTSNGFRPLVKMIDFGLASEKRVTGNMTVTGSVPYMAPEKIRSGPTDWRADLYSLGVTMFELLTGKPPFDGETTKRVLRAHLEDPVPNVQDSGSDDIPAELETLVKNLLEKDPSDRPLSANKVIERLGFLVGKEFSTETIETKKGYVRSSRFINRTDEINTLEGQWSQVESGKKNVAVVSIRGEAGIGKSRLVSEFKRKQQTEGAPILSPVTGLERSEYGLMRQVIKAFLRRANMLVENESSPVDRTLVTDYRTFLQHIAPDVNSDRNGEEEISHPVDPDRDAFLDRACDFVLEVSRVSPVIVILEDLHRADPESLEWIHYLWRRLCSSRNDIENEKDNFGLLLVTTSRPREEPEEFRRFLQWLQENQKDSRFLNLDLFSKQDRREFVNSMFRDVEETIVERILSSEHSGNPLFVEETLNQWIQNDNIAWTPGGWEMLSKHPSEYEVPDRIETILKNRVEWLDENQQQVFLFLILLGDLVSGSLLKRAERDLPFLTRAAFSELIEMGFVREEKRNGNIFYRIENSGYHNIVSETVSTKTKQDICDRMLCFIENLMNEGELEEEKGRICAADLAIQLEDPKAVKKHVPVAAKLSEQRLSMEDAYRYWKSWFQFEQGTQERSETFDDCMEAYGDVCRQTGRFEEAVNVFKSLAIANPSESLSEFDMREMTQSSDTLRHLRKYGKSLLESGDSKEGEQTFSTLIPLELFEEEFDLEAFREHYGWIGEDPAALPEILNALLDYSSYCSEEKGKLKLARILLDAARDLFEYCSENDYIEQEHTRKLEVSLYKHRGWIYYRLGQFDRAETAFTEGLTSMNRKSDRHQEGEFLHSLATVYYSTGEIGRALTYLEKAEEVYEALNDRKNLSICLYNRAVFNQQLGNYDRSRNCYEKYLQICRQLGDQQGVVDALINLGEHRIREMNLSGAKERFDEAMNIARKSNYSKGIAKTGGGLARYYMEEGNYEKALDCLEEYESHIDSDENVSEQARVDRIRSRLLFRRGDVQQAFHLLEKMDSVVDRFESDYFEADLQHLFGKFYLESGDTERARSSLNRSRDIYGDLGLSQEARGVLIDSGLVAASGGQFDRAEKTIEECYNYLLKSKYRKEVARCCFGMADLLLRKILYLSAGEWDVAEGLDTDSVLERINTFLDRGLDIAREQSILRCQGRLFQAMSLLLKKQWKRARDLLADLKMSIEETSDHRLTILYTACLDVLNRQTEQPEEGLKIHGESTSINQVLASSGEIGFHRTARLVEKLDKYFSGSSTVVIENGSLEKMTFASSPTGKEDNDRDIERSDPGIEETFQKIHLMFNEVNPGELTRKILSIFLDELQADVGGIHLSRRYFYDPNSRKKWGPRTDDAPVELSEHAFLNNTPAPLSEKQKKKMAERIRESVTRGTLVLSGSNQAEGDEMNWVEAVVVPMPDDGAVLGGVCLLFNEGRNKNEMDLQKLKKLGRESGRVLRNSSRFLTAISDSRTGLFSSAWLHTSVAREIKRHTKFGEKLALVSFDLTGLFNQEQPDLEAPSYSHVREVLLQILRKEAGIQKFSEKNHPVASEASDGVFELILPHTTKLDVKQFIHRVSTDLEREGNLDLTNGIKVIRTGGAMFPDDGNTSEELIQHARIARMYSDTHPDKVITFYSEVDSELSEAVLDTPKESLTERGRLSGEKRMKSDDRFSVLSALSEIIQSGLDMNSVLEVTIKTVVNLVNARSGYIIIRDHEDAFSIQARYFSSSGEQFVEDRKQKERERVSKQLVRSVLEEGEPRRIEDAHRNPEYRKFSTVENLELRSVLVVPVMTDRRKIGAIYLEDSAVARQFSQEDLQRVTELAEEISGFIENVQKHHTKMEELKQLKHQYNRMKSKMEIQSRYEQIVGESEPMQEVFDTLDRVIPTSLNIVIEGETGTGKELAARAVHYNGPRKDEPFLAVNCARFSETLLESELFGHLEGSFTDARQDKPGLFEQADGGTLFLDEISDMNTEMQAKLLRVLETGEVRRIGDERVRNVDVRVICATNQNLQKLMDNGEFREDLFYRLADARLHMPPLQKRIEDIPLLVDYFLKELAEEDEDLPNKKMEQRAVLELMKQDWPGNVRELRSAVRRAALFSADRDAITLNDLQSMGIGKNFNTRDGEEHREQESKNDRDQQEKNRIVEALKQADGKKTEAAELLGIHRSTLWRKMKKYNINL